MSCDGAQLAERIVVTVGVERGPNGHPVPSVDHQGVYPTCFEEGTWFAWKLERIDDPDGDPRKIPRAPWEYPNNPDRFVGHDDAEAWTDLDTARKWIDMLPGYELANRVPDVEPDERRPVFFDFDDVRDPETSEIHPHAWEFIQTHDLPAWFSTSGTGIHAFTVIDEIPVKYKPDTTIELPEWEHTDDPELELYTRSHFCALTGKHIAGTAFDAPDLTDTVGRMLRERGTKRQPETPDAFDPDAEPAIDRAELAEIQMTDEINYVFDAIRHTGPRDIRLRSTVTEERSDGSQSLDPSWEQSASGTRLAQVDDGWVYRKGNVGLDALQVVALEERISHSVKDYPSGEKFWKAVNALRERGAHIPEYDPPRGDERDPVAVVPFERVAELNNDAARDLLRNRGVEWPDTDAARDRLRDCVMRAFRAGEQIVLDAPTSLGKSHTVATEPWLHHADITDVAPVIHLSPTCDARDENAAKSRTAGVSTAVLKGRKDRCPVARGDHDPEDEREPDIVLTIDGEPVSEWFDRQCDWKGLAFQLTHASAAEYNDQDETLPCSTDDAECPAMTQWDGIPRDGDGNPAVDVVHATHHFAYVPGLRAHTNMVLDEQPGAFIVNLSHDRIRKAVNAYLDAVNAPVKTYGGLVSLATTDAYAGDIGVERDALEGMLGTTPAREWFVKHPDAHALAPDLTKAIYWALQDDPDTNGRRSTRVLHEPPRFDNEPDEGYGGNFLSVVIDDNHTVRTVRHVPDFSIARSVVGLDAHPCEPIWRQTVGPKLTAEPVLDPVERRLWRRFERGLTVVQVGDATRPLSGSNAREWFDADNKLDVFMRALRERYGDEWRTSITAANVEEQLADRMREAGVDDPMTMHYGEEMSRNDFAGESVGLVNGCIDPGDGYVLDLLAELDLDATPKRVDPTKPDDPTKALCPACGGRRCSECGRTGLKRATGRDFDGPDADVARSLVGSVRENHVAQAAGRYARNPDDPEDTATVYVRTDAVPDDFVDVKVNGVTAVGDRQREIMDQLSERGAEGATARGLAEDADCTSRHVRETLNQLAERGVVERDPGAGPNPDRWFPAVETFTDEQVDLLDRDRRDTPDRASADDAAENGEKAGTPHTRDSSMCSSSFSAKNSRLSASAEIDDQIIATTTPGVLALDTEALADTDLYAALDPRPRCEESPALSG